MAFIADCSWVVGNGGSEEPSTSEEHWERAEESLFGKHEQNEVL